MNHTTPPSFPPAIPSFPPPIPSFPRKRESTRHPFCSSGFRLEPEEIRRSKSDPEAVRLYHKWYYGTTEGDKWVCVVVKTFPDDAFVMTALVTPTIKGGDPL